jgi:hypothetical protein
VTFAPTDARVSRRMVSRHNSMPTVSPARRDGAPDEL